MEKIKKENIIPLIESVSANEICWPKDKKDIDEMLDKFINVLKLRAQILQ